MDRSFPEFLSATLAFAALLCLVVAPVPALAQDDDEVVVRKVDKIVKTRVHCDGDDCPEGEKRYVFIDDEGNTKVIEGGGIAWMSGEDGPGVHVMKRLHAPMGGGFLGVGLTELTPELRAHFGVPEDAGVMVSKVVDESPAQRAGVRVGDVITLVDGEAVASGHELARRISGREDGETVVLEVWRDGQAQRLSATVEEREGSAFAFHPRIHMRHGSGPMRHVEVHCEGGHCPEHHGKLDFDCDGAEECRVEVQCDGGECSCTVNGEAADCAEIGVPGE